jgi:hypothetical protein
MPYDPSDPRAQLASTRPTATANAVPRSAHYRELDASPADVMGANGSRTWWTRSQAMVVGYTRAQPDDELEADDVGGEHVVLVLDGAEAVIEHTSGGVATIGEPAVVVVPPGTSTVRVVAPGTIVRLFAAPTAPALAEQCANADEYVEPDGNVADFAAWPDPPTGHGIRVYPLAAHPLEEGRLGRIFRCSTLMVNVLPDDDRPRDPGKLSPHHHDDFEQVSLQVVGDYVHHMRVPWTPDSSTWRDDEHRRCAAPAVVVIPPPLVHTSQSVGEMRHWLIDVFAPPRLDFSQRPGWVLNAAEYPLPVA